MVQFGLKIEKATDEYRGKRRGSEATNLQMATFKAAAGQLV